MTIEVRGKNLLVTRLTRPMIDAGKELPGRKKFKDGQLWIEGSGANIEALLARFPDLAEAGLGPVNEFLGVKEAEERTRSARALPAEAAAFPFKTEPFEHQLKAFGLSRHAEFFGLFMEMGTGKTKILIDNAFALYSEGHIDRAIVVAPNGVHKQWVNQQLPQHAPDFEWDAFAYESGLGVKATRDMEARLDDKNKLQWFTMAFESLSSKKAQETFLRWIFDARTMVILDESQKIKNPGAKRTQFLLKCAEHINYRRIATGTEVTQGLEDLFTQFKFLHPHILGHNSFYSFRNEFCQLAPIPGAPVGAYKITGYRNIDKLKRAIAGCTFEVLKQDCLDLPEKIKVTREVPLTAGQRKAYKTMKDYMVAELENGGVVEAPIAITKLMKLQQITSGQLIDDEGDVHDLDTHRPNTVLEILEERKSAIVWCRFKHDIERLKPILEKEGYRVGTYYGDTPEEERNRVVQPGEVDVLIANPQSAGAGLNLTHFNTAIYYSNSFNAGDRWQSEDRIHRIGQEEKCLYIDLVAPNTVDEKLVEALARKRQIADSVRGGSDLDARELLADVLNDPF